MVFSKPPSFPKLVLFLYRLIRKHYRDQKGLQRSLSNTHSAAPEQQSQTSLSQRVKSSKNTTLIFNVEGTLLKSSSLFPYFMLVAFEAGSLIRALVLLALFPVLCLLNHEHSLKVMVMVSFLGLKKKSFRVGSSVLPKYFLEDVGAEVFEVLKRAKVNIAVTDMPQIMVESFLSDYLEIDFVTGRDLKTVCGYYVGLMEDKKNTTSLEDKYENANIFKNVLGLGNIDTSVQLQHPLFSRCKVVVMVSEVEKLKWTVLDKERYPKPLIFHDGRLAFRPTPLAMLAMFIWFPFGSILSIIRIGIAISLPYKISTPLLVYSGIKLELTRPNNHLVSDNTESKTKGSLYVCNHRTLLDPLFLSFGLVKPLAAVTYSLSRMSEILSPIRTVPLTRNRDKDREMMDKLLNQGDLVVCPEGTTCREPYLLRLSPLFTELSDDIVPVGMNTSVSMFHGTTASGLKCLDPIFFLMNPTPSYTVQILDKICGVSSCNDNQSSRFDVANRVQCQLGEALGFECTMLTRKDKYMILAGNEGVVSPEKKQ
ncbi:putative glycerol-3-phosphate 1-O-acyltransferase [Heracleum sosnowskyi]|uniref:Glycerol-3-phosphate 1-O-acyltransferase n=1 Tax=Heracleum sosnowskyi TaxID=360622 RepID=A0AAD8LXR0_9APIA|nr:putative glycerol-3-phosphate 1-O-acyltransferase [Heracleum sosnowskyi]